MIRVKIDKLLACYLKPLDKTGIVEPKDMKNFEIVKVCIFHYVYIIYACIFICDDNVDLRLARPV